VKSLRFNIGALGGVRGEQEYMSRFLWERQKERAQWEDLDVGERIILKWR
jgi:hypothetical protein